MPLFLNGIEVEPAYLNGPIEEVYVGQVLVYRRSSGGDAKVNITYMVDTGVSYVEEIRVGTTILDPKTFKPEKSGYEFVGWRLDNEADESVLTDAEANENTTLYAVFKKSVVVTYNANGGGGTTSESSGFAYYNNGTITEALITLRESGFTPETQYKNFSAWAEGSTDGTQYAAGQTISLAENTTFYAVWLETGSVSFTTLSTSSIRIWRTWVPR